MILEIFNFTILLLLFGYLQITFELTVKQLMSFDPGEWTETLRKEYVLVIEGFFTLPLPLLSSTYRRAIKVTHVHLLQKFKVDIY